MTNVAIFFLELAKLHFFFFLEKKQTNKSLIKKKILDNKIRLKITILSSIFKCIFE